MIRLSSDNKVKIIGKIYAITKWNPPVRFFWLSVFLAFFLCGIVELTNEAILIGLITVAFFGAILFFILSPWVVIISKDSVTQKIGCKHVITIYFNEIRLVQFSNEEELIIQGETVNENISLFPYSHNDIQILVNSLVKEGVPIEISFQMEQEGYKLPKKKEITVENNPMIHQDNNFDREEHVPHSSRRRRIVGNSAENNQDKSVESPESMKKHGRKLDL